MKNKEHCATKGKVNKNIKFICDFSYGTTCPRFKINTRVSPINTMMQRAQARRFEIYDLPVHRLTYRGTILSERWIQFVEHSHLIYTRRNRIPLLTLLQLQYHQEKEKTKKEMEDDFNKSPRRSRHVAGSR